MSFDPRFLCDPALQQFIDTQRVRQFAHSEQQMLETQKRIARRSALFDVDANGLIPQRAGNPITAVAQRKIRGGFMTHDDGWQAGALLQNPVLRLTAMSLGEQATCKPVAAEVLIAARSNLQSVQTSLLCWRKPGVWICRKCAQYVINASDLDLERGFHSAIFSSCQTVGANLAAICAAEVLGDRAWVRAYTAETMRTPRPLAS